MQMIRRIVGLKVVSLAGKVELGTRDSAGNSTHYGPEIRMPLRIENRIIKAQNHVVKYTVAVWRQHSCHRCAVRNDFDYEATLTAERPGLNTLPTRG